MRILKRNQDAIDWTAWDVIADSTKYILNMEQVTNPSTGQTFTVPLGHRWYDPTDGSITGSNPGNNPSIIELQPVN